MHYIIIYCEENFDRVSAFKNRLDVACPQFIGSLYRVNTEESQHAVEEALRHRLWIFFFTTPLAYLCQHFMTFRRRIIKYSWMNNINCFIPIFANEVDCSFEVPVGCLHGYGTYILFERDSAQRLARQCRKYFLTFRGYGRCVGYQRRCNRNKLSIQSFYQELEEDDSY